MTPGWTSAVCDTNQCYLVNVATEEFDLPGNESGLIDVHLYPGGIWEGYALIEVVVEDVSDPTASSVGVFVYDSQLTGTHEAQQIPCS